VAQSRWSTRWPEISTPDQFDDDYRDAMRRLIEAKAEGAESAERPEPKREEAVDLMTALQRSVEAARSAHRGGASKRSTKSGSGKSETSKSGSARRKRGSTTKRSA
jgi:DNA end-binding protein Ku